MSNFVSYSQQTGKRGQKKKLCFLDFSLNTEQWKWKRNNLESKEVCASWLQHTQISKLHPDLYLITHQKPMSCPKGGPLCSSKLGKGSNQENCSFRLCFRKSIFHLLTQKHAASAAYRRQRKGCVYTRRCHSLKP